MIPIGNTPLIRLEHLPGPGSADVFDQAENQHNYDYDE